MWKGPKGNIDNVSAIVHDEPRRKRRVVGDEGGVARGNDN